MKTARFTLPELFGALVGLAVIGFVIFLVVAAIHYIMKFW